ncbi:hydroxysqualene dehydroxylase [Dyella flagellata]|uniref:Phytoene dehydrogenase n=1 Tax=Dyella flagellata TaxID=1867833 RepID=A0ABQ5XF87_9GAMM|nr:FAD-dependent oxidoreductase [Dyella flagellata]GLQ89104.1 phytoene dehydrogenase [Dyella flagellata]
MPIRCQNSRNATAAPFSLQRRRFMQSTAFAGAAMALGLPGFSARAAGSGKTVAIIGGGVAGLSAAHELAERGFKVSVYEQRAWGGKVRTGTGTGGRLDLPGQYGFPFLGGFYNNLPDTLQRIPFAKTTDNVQGNMPQSPQLMLAAGGQRAYVNNSAFTPFSAGAAGLPAAIHSWLQDAFFALEIPAEELAYFVSKFHVFMTSSDARRLRQWESMSWWDYVGAATRSSNYQRLIGTPPISTVHSKEASARSVGQALEASFYAGVGQGYRPAVSTISDQPKHGWIDTWCRHLASLGVSLNLGVQATQFQYVNGRVTGVLADAAGHPLTIKADWYVLAVPSEKVAALLPAAMREADSQFAGIEKLEQRWVASVQFLLAQAAPIHQGPFACLHSPWAVTGISRVHSRPVGFAATHGDGTVQSVLSLDVSDWTTAGVLYGLPAAQCTQEQIAQEVLAQLRHDLPNGHSALPDSMIQSWAIDPAVTGLGTADAAHADPLFVNTAGSWYLRPDTTTTIPNFFLAGDYVRATGAAFASMEAANESGRRAANAILAASGSGTAPAKIYSGYTSPLLIPDFTADATRFSACLPNKVDLLDPYCPHCLV